MTLNTLTTILLSGAFLSLVMMVIGYRCALAALEKELDASQRDLSRHVSDQSASWRALVRERNANASLLGDISMARHIMHGLLRDPSTIVHGAAVKDARAWLSDQRSSG